MVPGLATFIAPLNILKLVALFPVQYNLKFVKFLKLLVKFEEEDILAKLFQTKQLYSEDYMKQKRYTPKNIYFQYISIYPRIRGLKILLRILINIAFFFFAWKICKILGNDKKFLKNRKIVDVKEVHA